jgi:hypothetical protein
MEVEVRKQDGSVISEKRDTTIVDTANPFGNVAEVNIEDDNGDLYDEFPFGTRVEIYVRDLLTDFEVENEDDLTIESGETLTVEETETRNQRVITNAGILENQGIVKTVADDPRPAFQQRFTGYVVERNDQNEQSGRDNLQLTVYSFDQLLRADSVSNNQTGKTITAALEDIIKTDTAVTWNSNNVSVVDEQELTESLQGEKVEDALLKLSKKSVDEQFGVNDSIEFFFREQEPVAAPNDIGDGDWIDYQLPERGEENKNESRTYFDPNNSGESDRVAVVDDGVNQLELQESLGTDDPVVIANDRERGDLSDVDDAGEDAEQNLEDKEVAKVYEFVGEAEDFLSAQPGEVFDVEIQAGGIDGEFRIAELEYQDVGSTVRITAIRNKGNTDDVLRRVTERLRRQELQTADFDGPEDRINIAEVGVEIADSLTVDGVSWDNTRITNTLRNQIRDGWGGQGNVNVSEIAVGTDPSNLARTNESLENQVATASVSETLNGSFAVDYDASFSQTDIQEIGLLDGSGNLLYRAVNDTAESPGTVALTLTVNNNPDIPKAVVTDLGRTSIRDIIADNSPSLPVNYGFGSDQTEPSTSDTTLGNSLFVSDLTETLIQDGSSQAELENLAGTIADDKPLEIVNGQIQPKQTSFSRQVNDEDTGDGVVDFTLNAGDGSSDDVYGVFQSEGSALEYNFTFDHRIPNEEIDVRYRWVAEGIGDVDSFTFTLNGKFLDSDFPVQTISGDGYEWERTNNDPNDQDDNWNFTEDIEPGVTYTLRVELTSEGTDNDVRVDLFSIGDKRQSVDLPAELTSGTEHLDGPQDYPQQVTQTFAEVAETRRELDFAKAELDIDNTDNGQFVELSNDGGNTFIRTDNSATATANFASPSREVTSRIGLSRHGTRTDQTPLTGFLPQQLNAWTLLANPLAVLPDGIGTALTIGIIPRGEIVGSTIRELGQLDSSENTLTRSIRAALAVESEMRVFGRERLQITQA